MNKEEIKEYLQKVDELEAKLTGEDKETLQWLIYGYNQCAKFLNETEGENKQLKDNWNELKNYLEKQIIASKSASSQQYYFNTIYKLMQELEHGKDD